MSPALDTPAKCAILPPSPKTVTLDRAELEKLRRQVHGTLSLLDRVLAETTVEPIK
jgi:hypothetical protein